jgi:hypothetical protein
MKEFVQEEDKAVNMEIFEEKEERFITNIKREINNDIDKIKNPEKNRYNERNYYEEDEDLILPGLEEFNIYDKKMKKFIGFNSDIIPGDIVREEIIQIARNNSMALYRVEYYTKYHKADELRNTLLKENKNKKEDKKENGVKKEEKKDEDKKDDNKDEGKKEENKREGEDKKDGGKQDLENENIKEREDKENEKDKASRENNEDRNSSNNEEENKEEIEEIPEITETEIDNSLEKEKRNVDKYDVSEKNENSFIYRVFDDEMNIILEDKSLKDKNKVKSTLYRFIFTNKDGREKYYRAILKSKKIDDKIKANSFIPPMVFAKIGPNDISNFYNIMRIRGDLPFLKRGDANISISLSNDFKLDDD